jgi:hypothetical protein
MMPQVLLTGWFSFDTAEVTAGDLLAEQTVRRWLDEAGVPHRTAMAANFRSAGEVAWTMVDPGDVTHLLFICGPAGGSMVEQLFARFAGAERIIVGASVVDGTADLAPELVIARDDTTHRSSSSSPDLSLASVAGSVPVVGVVRGHEQPEYGDRHRLHDAHRLMDGLLIGADVAPVTVDTRLHPGEAHLCATPEQLESALARFDLVVSTRLHGLVLSLKVGVPALAVDPVVGGGKVTSQAKVLGWPAVIGVESPDTAAHQDLLAWCLTSEARDLATSCVAQSLSRLELTRKQLLHGVLGDEPTPARSPERDGP